MGIADSSSVGAPREASADPVSTIQRGRRAQRWSQMFGGAAAMLGSVLGTRIGLDGRRQGAEFLQQVQKRSRVQQPCPGAFGPPEGGENSESGLAAFLRCRRRSGAGRRRPAASRRPAAQEVAGGSCDGRVALQEGGLGLREGGGRWTDGDDLCSVEEGLGREGGAGLKVEKEKRRGRRKERRNRSLRASSQS